MSAIQFSQPDSVIRIAPRSGVFGSSKFLHDKQGFISVVIGKWFSDRQNTLSGETVQHHQAASDLFDFYVSYRNKADKGCGNLGSVLGELIETGSIKLANEALKVADARGIFAYDRSAHLSFGHAFRKKAVTKIEMSGGDPLDCSQLATALAELQNTYQSTESNLLVVWVDAGEAFDANKIASVSDYHDVSRLGLLTVIYERQLLQA